MSASEAFLVSDDPSRGSGIPECFVVSDSYRSLKMQDYYFHMHMQEKKTHVEKSLKEQKWRENDETGLAESAGEGL
ncbi:hypothetical protein DNTS_017907, partial [Danionella cerebrum]